MTKSGPILTLLSTSFRSWIGARGFWLVVIAALLPVALTGAWIGSHRDDVAVTAVRVEGDAFNGEPVEIFADVVNLGARAVTANVTLAVGHVQVRGAEAVLVQEASETRTLEALAPGETRTVNVTWTATTGVVFAVAIADQEDLVGEREETNNERFVPIAVKYRAPDASRAPSAPVGLAGDANATLDVDLVVEKIERSADIAPGQNATFTATIRNNGLEVTSEVVVRVSRDIGGRSIAVAEKKENVTFAAGETKTIELPWTAQEGVFWHEAWATPPPGTRDPNAADNYKAEPVPVSATIPTDLRQPDPIERATIKNFYTSLLAVLYLRVVLPLIALFYAAGVIADEKDRGALAYILTRPLQRWLIPITKFAASFLVAAVATIVGVAITYALLFGLTNEGGNIGYLTTPLLASLVTIFAYGAVFTLLGTIFDRPYLIGLLVVLGWETVATAAVGSSQVALAAWVRNLTLTHHIQTALGGWRLDEGVQWLPADSGARIALGIIGAIGVGALAASAIWMKRREFQVG